MLIARHDNDQVEKRRAEKEDEEGERAVTLSARAFFRES